MAGPKDLTRKPDPYNNDVHSMKTIRVSSKHYSMKVMKTKMMFSESQFDSGSQIFVVIYGRTCEVADQFKSLPSGGNVEAGDIPSLADLGISHTANMTLVNGILATVNSLFKKFRYQDKSDPLLLDLKYCLDNFAVPLLSAVENLSVKMSGAGGNAVVDNADKWMNECKNYLTVRYPVVEDSGADGLALVDGLRAAVCDNISRYMEKEELSVHHSLFAGDEILQQITQSVVIPNVMLRKEDEKGIAGNYKEKITAKVSEQIRNYLALFEQNPATNWKYKDCAIYLVVYLATKKAGGASVSTDLVDIDSFFRTVIVPELQGQDVNAFPMLKAGALNLILFQSHR
ncbi:exportin-2 [Tanacetum coccineum]